MSRVHFKFISRKYSSIKHLIMRGRKCVYMALSALLCNHSVVHSWTQSVVDRIL